MAAAETAHEATLTTTGTTQNILLATGSAQNAALVATGTAEQEELQAAADQLEDYTDTLAANVSRVPRGNWVTPDQRKREES